MMASLPVVLRAYVALERDISNPLIQGMTTKSGRITIPLFKWMEYASDLEEEYLSLYEAYIRKDKETRAFISLVGLSYGVNKTGREREFTFDLIVDGYEVHQLLAGYISESQLKDISSEVNPVPVTPTPQKATRKCPKTELAAETLSCCMIKAAVPRGESAEKHYAQVGEGYAGAEKTEEREIVLGECGCRRRERGKNASRQAG
jgi:hypothetical protein